MSSAGSVTPVSAAPSSTAAAALRAEILGAAQSELIAMLGAVQDIEAPAPHGPATAATPANPVAQAADAAKTASAAQQGSLAPLFADLGEIQSLPNLPAPIKAAISQVLALQLPTDGPIAAEDVRQAIAQSGLFLEADLATPGAPPAPDLKAALLTLRQALPAPAPAPTPAATAEAAPAEASPASPVPQSQPTAPAAQGAAPSPQAPAPVAPPGSPAPPLAAQPAQIQAAQAQPTPASAEPAQVLATAIPPSAPQAAAGQVPQAQAPAASSTASPALPPTTAAPSAPPPQVIAASAPPETPEALDPKAALLALQQAPPTRPAEEPAEAAPQGLRAALLALQQATREPAAALPPPARPTPPPVRDAALSPQAPAPSTLPARADLADLADHLRPQVEQALARLTLHQLASLPDGESSAWMFEVPLATPQGTAMAQFEVERDGEGSGGADGDPPWRARFSVDIEPLGPVHVHVAMTGGKAAVSVWAERADSLAWLRGQGGDLASALPAEVVFRAGTPGGAVPARGHFLDQTS